MLQDFWSHGTALSAPAPILAGLGLLALIARRRGKLGTTATAILLVLMALALIAGVLEPVVRQALRGDFPPLPRIGILVLTIVDLVLAVVVLLAAGGQLRARVASDGAAKGAA